MIKVSRKEFKRLLSVSGALISVVTTPLGNVSIVSINENRYCL